MNLLKRELYLLKRELSDAKQAACLDIIGYAIALDRTLFIK